MENQVSKRLSTMLPMEVMHELTRFAKEEASTGLGKFDYGFAIKLLLERSDVNKRMERMEIKLNTMEEKI